MRWHTVVGFVVLAYALLVESGSTEQAEAPVADVAGPPLGHTLHMLFPRTFVRNGGGGGGSAYNDTCGQDVEAKFHCTAPGCEDLVPGA
jgi:hypothetical protein